MIELPTTRKMSDAERFIYGFRKLAEECNLSSITYNGLGPQRFEFNDGTSIGSLALLSESGLISKDKLIRY